MTSPITTGEAEGRRRRDQGTSKTGANHPTALRLVQRAILQTLLRLGPATIDAVRPALDHAGIPNPVWGAATLGLSTAGLIRPTAYVTSSRPEAHGRPVRVLELVGGHDRVRAWFRDNPEPTEAAGTTPNT